MDVPQQFHEIAEKVKTGSKPEATVRTLLSWFGAYRRSWRNVKTIREALDQVRLVTYPDFEGQYIDSSVMFLGVDGNAQLQTPDGNGKNEGTAPLPAAITVASPQSESEGGDVKLADLAHRINRLASANSPPMAVPPDASVEQAVTLMFQNDYSQLPVMIRDREVKGLFSWKSLGARLALGKTCKLVRECMDRHQEIPYDASMFDAVRIIVEHDCVLVRDANKAICGIVTASDISIQFQQLTEPFLLLGDIESRIRYLIDAKFSAIDLQTVKDPTDADRKIEDASDLTFGEYVRLLQNENMWAKLQARIDRKTFTDELDRVRQIRNDVMHFDPDPIEPADMKRLKQFATFLERLQALTDGSNQRSRT
ncbi:MAG: CBS domain-containing protein [Bacillota bacterium]